MAIRPGHPALSFLYGIVLFLILPLASLSATKQDLPPKRAGLKTNYSKIAVANLPIGQTVSLTEIANAPMLVGNNFEVPVFAEIRTETPEGAKEGYAPIPDSGWVVIEPSGITLPAMASARVDVKVTLPDDETLFGKKFFCKIVILTGGDSSIKSVRFGAQLTGYLMFSIAPMRNEQGLERVLQNPADAAYEIEPAVVIMDNVKPGQKINILTSKKKKIQLINHSNNQQQYFLHSMNPNETNYQRIANSQPGKNADDVILGQTEIKLGPGKKKNLDIAVQVPRDVHFDGQSLTYLVSITNGIREGVVRYLAIYINGERIAEKTKDEKPLILKEEPLTTE